MYGCLKGNPIDNGEHEFHLWRTFVPVKLGSFYQPTNRMKFSEEPKRRTSLSYRLQIIVVIAKARAPY